MRLEVAAKGIKNFQKYLKNQPAKAEKAAQLAVDSATRHAYTLGRREMQRQVNFKTQYLTSSEGGNPRYFIASRPRKGSLKGVIKGRVRSTSLHRFKTAASDRNGVKVNVSGSTRRLKRGFVMKLRNNNRGIAVRLPKGEGLKNRKLVGKPIKGASNKKTNLYLLYGPSVQQVFTTVAPDIAPEVNQYLGDEFLRQFARLK